MKVVSRLRTKKMMPWKLVEFIWRRKHSQDIWNGLVTCLKEVSFFTSQGNNEDVPFWTEVIEEQGNFF